MSTDPESKKPSPPTFPSVQDKPLSRGQSVAPLSTFAYIFAEMVRYYQNQVDHIHDLESGLHKAGYGIGLRLLELFSLREKAGRREKNLVDMLQFIYSTVWKAVFNKQADGLEKSMDKSEEVYYLFEKEPITNKFTSVPKNFGQLNCASFIAGIINGILDGADIPVIVTANWNSTQTQTVYVIKPVTSASGSS